MSYLLLSTSASKMIRSVIVLFGLVALVYTSTSPKPTNAPTNTDHLLNVLEAMHKSHTYSTLPSSEKVLLVELLSAAEVDQITHLIDRIGFARIATFLDHVTKIDQAEAHLLEHYLIQELNQENTPQTQRVPHHSRQSLHEDQKRDLQAQINLLMHSHLYLQLNEQDRALLLELFKASETQTVTPLVHRVGYSRIIGLIEDIASPSDTHLFLSYLVNHMDAESGGINSALG